MKISIVIPVYYNAGSIHLTYSRIIGVIENHSKVTDYEIIFVEDGSKDSSFTEILKIVDENPRVKVIKFTRNFGQVPAIYAGYKKSTGDIVITLSADLQDPPELISQMIDQYLSSGSDIVICSRKDRDETYFRKATSAFFYAIMRRLSFENMPNGGFDFVLINRKVINHLNSLNEANIFWQGQLLWSGFPITFIPYTRQKREIGKSRWTFGKKIKYLIDGVMGYSFAPIRFITLLGLLIFFAGLIYSGFILYNYFQGASPFNGWTPLMMVSLLLGGFQLLVLGVIGEYVWRTLDQVRNRPLFIVEKEVSNDK